MNVRHPISTALRPAVLNLAFSDDRQCFVAALENGFKVYTTEDCELRDSRDTEDGIALATMLETTRYFGLVGGGRHPKYDPTEWLLWDQKTQQPLLTQGYATPILRLHINRDHFLISLRNGIILYANPGRASTAPKCLATYKTVSNPYGLCCLGKRYMAFLGQSAGQVWIVELPKDGQKGDVGIIPAHDGAIRQLCMSSDEQFIATASEKGTIIRVFSTLTDAKVAEFRRGIDPAIIYGLAFSPSNVRLAATGDKGTLHIFELPTAPPPQSRPQSSAASHRRSTSSSTAAAVTASAHNEEWENVPSSGQREQKWGALASVPIAPRIFRDTYSSASAAFDLGDEPDVWQAGSIGFSLSSYSAAAPPRPCSSSASVSSVSSTATEKPVRTRGNAAVPGWPGGRPPKGILGWLSKDEVVVLGAGQSAMWQSFYVQKNPEGKLVCWRRGWKKINEP